MASKITQKKKSYRYRSDANGIFINLFGSEGPVAKGVLQFISTPIRLPVEVENEYFLVSTS